MLHLPHANGKVWAVCLSRGKSAAKRPRGSILPRAGEDLVSGRSARTHTQCSVSSPLSHGLCFRRPISCLPELSLLHCSVRSDAFASPELLIAPTSRVQKLPCLGMPRYMINCATLNNKKHGSVFIMFNSPNKYQLALQPAYPKMRKSD